MRMVYLAFGWVAGILVAASSAALVPLVWLALLGAMVFGAGIGWRTRWRWWWLAGVAFALAGCRFALVPQTSSLALFNDQNVTVQGEIIAPVDVRDDRVQFRLAADLVITGEGAYETSGLVLVNAPRVEAVAYGDTVQATGRLATPAEFDTFSYADYLGRRGVFSIMYGAIVEPVDSGGGNPLFAALLQLKAQTQQHIAQALPEPQAGLLTGILLGNERGISPDLADDFSRTGASHIIAISGFNMVIVAGLVMGILRRLQVNPRIAALLGVIVLAIYTIFVGANAAVVRAAVMSSLLVVAPVLRRKTFVPASLAFVVIAMSAQQPLVLWSLSFQLSVFAVLGLALFTDPLTRRFDALVAAVLPPGWARNVSSFLNEPLIVTIASLVMTLPLTVVYFQRLSLVSVLVNLLIVPVQSPLLIIGGLAAILSFVVPALAQVLFWVDMLLLSWSIGVVRFFADLPYADINFVLDPRLVALFFLLIIGGATVDATRPAWATRIARFIRQRPVFNAVWLSGMMVGALLFAAALSRPDGLLHIWFLDVGHSNAVLVQTPRGAHMLVDGGRFPSRLLTSIGDRLPFYDRELELVVVTQPDEFDVGALPAVLSRYRAGAILTNGQTTQSEFDAALREAFAPYETVTVHAGYEAVLDDGVTLEVLHPAQPPDFGDPLGDGALVLRLNYGEVSLLITGDASRSAQREMLENGNFPLADILQLPQHGTARSLDDGFLAAVQPQVIVLQSDATNPRGDPDNATLALIDTEVPFFRTDEQGTLHLWTDGETLWVQPQETEENPSP